MKAWDHFPKIKSEWQARLLHVFVENGCNFLSKLKFVVMIYLRHNEFSKKYAWDMSSTGSFHYSIVLPNLRPMEISKLINVSTSIQEWHKPQCSWISYDQKQSLEPPFEIMGIESVKLKTETKPWNHGFTGLMA